MTQEQVAAELGVRHTTVGRWEKGEMRLSTQDLERLAVIYGATTTQLAAAPAAASDVAILDKLHSIANGMDPAVLARWMAIGEDLKRK